MSPPDRGTTHRTQPRPDTPDAILSSFDAAPVGLAVVGHGGVLLAVNEAFASLLGGSPSDLVGRDYTELTHPEDLPADAAARADLMADGEGPTIEKRFLRPDGASVWTRTTVRLVYDAAGAPLHGIGVVEDIRDRRQEEERLRWLALHDPLTGAGNRALLDDRLAQALAARDRDGGVVAVVLADIDGFKSLNDRLGHAGGDQVLVAFVAAARAVLREQDAVARMGGDEFTFVVHAPSEREIRSVLVRLRAALRTPVAVDEALVSVGTSVGVAFVRGPGRTPEAVLAEADASMYEAKRLRAAHRRPFL